MSDRPADLANKVRPRDNDACHYEVVIVDEQEQMRKLCQERITEVQTALARAEEALRQIEAEEGWSDAKTACVRIFAVVRAYFTGEK